MRKLNTPTKWLVALALIGIPIAAFGLTGVIITPYGTTGVATSPGYGKIEVKYNSATDESHPTQWRLVDGQGPGAWMNVTGSTLSGCVAKRTATYGVDFQRTTSSPADTKPASRTVTVVEGQCITLKVKYN